MYGRNFLGSRTRQILGDRDQCALNTAKNNTETVLIHFITRVAILMAGECNGCAYEN